MVELTILELEEIVRLKKILNKSTMTQQQADALSDEVNLSLSKKYLRLSPP